MAVSTVDYGTFKTHTGTLAEVAAAVKGRPASAIIGFTYNSTTSVYTIIERR